MKQRNLTGGSLVAPNSLGLVSTPDDGVRVLGTVVCLLYAPSCEASEKPAPYRKFKELVKNRDGIVSSMSLVHNAHFKHITHRVP